MKIKRRQELIHQAEGLVRRGRPKRALALYLKVLKEDPNDTRVLNRAGDLCARLSRPKEAVSFYKRAARLFHEQGFHVKAIALCKMIIRLDPELIGVMETLAKLQAGQGLVHEAAAQWEEVVNYYRQQGPTTKVVEALQAIVELQPNDPSRRLELAELYQQQSQQAKALAEYRAIAAVLISHGRAEEAMQVCVKALDIDAGDLDFVAEAVADLRAAGYAEEASRLLEAAVEKNPEARSLEGRLDAEPMVALEEEGFEAPLTLGGEAPAAASTEEQAEASIFDSPVLEKESRPAVEEVSSSPAGSEPAKEAPQAEATSDTGGFIDLAAELEAELEQEEAWQIAEPGSPLNTQNLEEIVEGLSVEASAVAADEDCDTHFSLGIAYQDMGLIDEAVGEFQKAAKDARYLVESSSRLATCFMRKGFVKLALKWIEKGLQSPTLVEEEAEKLRGQLAEIRQALKEGNPSGAGEDETVSTQELELLAQPGESGSG